MRSIHWRAWSVGELNARLIAFRPAERITGELETPDGCCNGASLYVKGCRPLVVRFWDNQEDSAGGGCSWRSISETLPERLDRRSSADKTSVIVLTKSFEPFLTDGSHGRR
jgi:hypothetical protein